MRIGCSCFCAVFLIFLSPTICLAEEARPALDVAPWSVTPFVLLLLGIATLPLFVPHFWHSNRNRALFAGCVSLPTVLYLLFLGPPAVGALLHSLEEYSAFILFLGSLYTICGGMVLRMNPPPTPRTNLTILAVGAVLTNLIGTTGAAMLLIRPFLRINRERLHKRHLPVFFIFIVCNVGGLLTPLGDPPLFLGFLRKVDFFWTLQLWPQWLMTNGILLGMFLLWERRACRREPARVFERRAEEREPLQVRGKRNLLLLAGLLFTVLLHSSTIGQGLARALSPLIPCPDLTLQWPLPEVFMGLLLLASWAWTPRRFRAENGYSWEPILEVAILFLGIFITMVPALEMLKAQSEHWHFSGPWAYFWMTGSLSSFLDNAPTYLTFATVAAGKGAANFSALSLEQPRILAAISCGAVFMGANTYIGNGPNFMVKAICDENRMPCPSFFGYMACALFVLMPIWAALTVVFFL